MSEYPNVKESGKIEVTNDIEAVLSERKKTHGSFEEHARYSQSLKNVLHQSTNMMINDQMMESLEMICHKIGRILAGNPSFKDHWTDIIGYARLIEKDL